MQPEITIIPPAPPDTLTDEDFVGYSIPADNQPMEWEALRVQIQRISSPPRFPKALMVHVQANWGHYAPHFRESLAHFASHPVDYGDIELSIQIYAGYLLAQFRDDGCMAQCQQLLALDAETLETSLGEEYLEVLKDWLAALCHHSAQSVGWLADVCSGKLGHTAEHRYCAIAALGYCAAEGLIARSHYVDIASRTIEQFITEAENGSLKQDPKSIFDYTDYTAFIACDIADIELSDEMLQKIKQWYAQGHIFEGIAGFGEIEEAMHKAQERKLLQPDIDPWPSVTVKKLPGNIITQIGWWAWFHTEEPGPDPDGYGTPFDPYPSYLDNAQEFATEPYVRLGAKTGRNDPCTCGSGKKFKKCCGA